MRSAEKTLKGKGFIKQEIEKNLSPADAKRVWDAAHIRLEHIYGSYRDIPKKVATHTDGFIFPAAAIYLSLKKYAPDKAYEIMKTTMREKSEKSGRLWQKWRGSRGLPGFFSACGRL